MIVSVAEDKLAEKIVEATVVRIRPSLYTYGLTGLSIYGTVIRIMVALKAAGIPNVGMITTPEEEPGPAR